MKVLMLVISSDEIPVVFERARAVWRKYMNVNPEIACYFITFKQCAFPHIDGDTFYIPGNEGYYQILIKTILAFEYFLLKDNWDFIIRTNLSSFWDFNRTMEYLKTLPSTGVFTGAKFDYVVPEHRINNQNREYISRLKNGTITTVSGSGIVFSKDVVELLVREKEKANILFSAMEDDLCMGIILNNNGFFPQQGTRLWHTEIPNDYSSIEHGYHYRLKAEHDRMTEGALLLFFYDHVYGDKRR